MFTFVKSAITATIIATASQAKVTYTYHDKKLSQPKAQAACEDKGGNLATIRSKKELTQIKKLAKNYGWFGAIKSNKEWKWSTGERTIIKVNKNFPTKIGGYSDDCALFEHPSKLYGYNCSNRYVYYCEKRDSEPKPTAPDGDNCEAKAVSFKNSFKSPKTWKAFQERTACKEKASDARSVTRTAAVVAYLKRSKAAGKSKAAVTETQAGQKEAAERTDKAAKALAKAKKTMKEGEAADKKAVSEAEAEYKEATQAGEKANNAHKQATEENTKQDAKLSALKAAAEQAHAAFGKGLKDMAKEAKA